MYVCAADPLAPVRAQRVPHHRQGDGGRLVNYQQLRLCELGVVLGQDVLNRLQNTKHAQH
jgi:hypothetical protein